MLASASTREGTPSGTPSFAPARLRACTDPELVEHIRSGSAPAFEVVVQRYERPLRTYAARMVGPERSQDVIQQTFLNALLALRKDRREVVLRPWLYCIARNQALNLLAERSGRHEPLSDDIVAGTQPADVIELRVRLSTIIDELHKLPERQRTALVAREFEGRSYSEIAERVGGNENVARALIMRARGAVRRAAYGVVPWPLARWLTDHGSSTMTTVSSGGAGAPIHFAAILVTTAAVAVGATVALPHHRTSVKAAMQADAGAPQPVIQLSSAPGQPPASTTSVFGFPLSQTLVGPADGSPASGSAAGGAGATSPLAGSSGQGPAAPSPSSSRDAAGSASQSGSSSAADPSASTGAAPDTGEADPNATTALASDASAAGTTTDPNATATTDPSATTTTDPNAPTTDPNAPATTDPSAPTTTDPNATTPPVDPNAAVSAPPAVGGPTPPGP